MGESACVRVLPVSYYFVLVQMWQILKENLEMDKKLTR
jgi:hypothetical protein